MAALSLDNAINYSAYVSAVIDCSIEQQASVTEPFYEGATSNLFHTVLTF